MRSRSRSPGPRSYRRHSRSPPRRGRWDVGPARDDGPAPRARTASPPRRGNNRLHADALGRVHDIARVDIKPFAEWQREQAADVRVLDRTQLEERYETYKRLCELQVCRAYFAAHRHEPWFQDRYSASGIARTIARRREQAAAAADSWLEELKSAAASDAGIAAVLPKVEVVDALSYSSKVRRSGPGRERQSESCILFLPNVPECITEADIMAAFTAQAAQLADKAKETAELTAAAGLADDSATAGMAAAAQAAVDAAVPPTAVHMSNPMRPQTHDRGLRSAWVVFPSAAAAAGAIPDTPAREIFVEVAAGAVDAAAYLSQVQGAVRDQIVIRTNAQAASAVAGGDEELQSLLSRLLQGSSVEVPDDKAEQARSKAAELKAAELERVQALFDLRAEVSSAELAAAAGLSVSLDTVPPPASLPRAMPVRVTAHKPFLNDPIIKELSQPGRVLFDLDLALDLARALDREAQVTPLAPLPSAEDGGDAVSTKSAFSMVTSNAWACAQGTRVDELLADVKAACPGITELQTLDVVIEYLGRVHLYGYYRGNQYSSLGEYIATCQCTPAVRFLVADSDASQPAAQGTEQATEAIVITEDAGDSEGVPKAAAESVEAPADVEDAEAAPGEEQGEQEEAEGADEEEEAATAAAIDPLQAKATHAARARMLSSACGAISTAGESPATSKFGRRRHLPQTVHMLRQWQQRVRCARRALCVLAGVPSARVLEIEAQAVQLGKMTEASAAGAVSADKFAAMLLQNVSEQAERSLSRLHPLCSVEKVQDAANTQQAAMAAMSSWLGERDVLLAGWYAEVLEQVPGDGSEEPITRCKLPPFKQFQSRFFAIRHLHNKQTEAAEAALAHARPHPEVLFTALASVDMWGRFVADDQRPFVPLRQQPTREGHGADSRFGRAQSRGRGPSRGVGRGGRADSRGRPRAHTPMGRSPGFRGPPSAGRSPALGAFGGMPGAGPRGSAGVALGGAPAGPGNISDIMQKNLVSYDDI